MQSLKIGSFNQQHDELDGMRLYSFCPEPVRYVIETLEQQGHTAVLVGGAVRDLILGRPIQDYDVATAAMPEEVQRAFRTVIPTGVKHGTVTVMASGMPIEVTTFRGEGQYSDGRRPDSVRLGVDLLEDLGRRDFTINAMALDRHGTLHDPYGGLNHLQAQTLVAVGNAKSRLSEDRLRKLRALRFMSQLGLSLDDALSDSLLQDPTLAGVSAERIKTEMDKLLLGPWVALSLETMASTGMLPEVLPELVPLYGYSQDHPAHRYDAFKHTLFVLEALEAATEVMSLQPLDSFWRLALGWAALYHDAGKPAVRTVDDSGVAHYYGHQQASLEFFSVAASRLRFSRRLQGAVSALIEAHMQRPVVEARPVRRWLRRVGEALVPFMSEGDLALGDGDGLALAASAQLVLMQADAMGTGTYDDAAYHLALRDQVLAVLTAGAAFTRASLAINGSDLLVAFPVLTQQRQWMKPLLEALVNHCLEQPEGNTPDNLMTVAAEWLAQWDEK